MSNDAAYHLIPMQEALRLLLLYKERAGQRHSWGEVERDIQNSGHKYADLVDRKKLRFWETGRTILNEKAFEAVTHFILSDKFTGIVPEAPEFTDTRQETIEAALAIADQYQYRFDRDDRFKMNFFYKLEGFWGAMPVYPPMFDLGDYCTNEVLIIYFYAHPVRDHDFALVHFYVTSIWPKPMEDAMKFYSGFMFINNNNEDEDSDIILHLWDRETGEKQIVHYDFNAHGAASYERRIAFAYSWHEKDLTERERYDILDVKDKQFSFAERARKNLTRFQQINTDNGIPPPESTPKVTNQPILNIDYDAVKIIFDKTLWNVIPRSAKLD